MANVEYRRVWIIDAAGETREEIPRRIGDLIAAVGAPELKMNHDTVNMWWRKDSPVIRLESRLEKTMPLVAAIYVQGYGTSLVIGRVVIEPDSMNRFKWMAAAAFEHLIDHAIGTVVRQEDGREVTERGEKSSETGAG